jgi:hypothetical protein
MAAGGGGGAAESPQSRAQTYYNMNPNASREELMAVGQGMTPMQYANMANAKKLVVGTKGAPGAFTDVQNYGKQMAGLAQGGLMVRGLQQLRTGLQTPVDATGMESRMAGRYGLTATPEQQAMMAQQAALAQTSSNVGLMNQGRAGLAEKQRDMRLGGITI